MAAQVRRVVTGHDADGAAIIISDSHPPMYRSPQGIAREEIWSTDATPASISDPRDPDARVHGLAPPRNGTALKIVEFPPETTAHDGADDILAAATASGHARHPGMHRTQTVDYCLILDGEIFLFLDHSECLMRRGDVVVQRGTNHAWSNRSGAPCRVAFFMIDGAP